MECCLAANGVKVLTKAVHCMAKLGEDISIECHESMLVLQIVNDSRSAFGCFSFLPTFFNHYQKEPDDNLERVLEECVLALDLTQNRLKVVAKQRQGVTKVFQLYIEDCDNLTAVFDKDKCRNTVCGHPHVLSEGVANFQAGLEEISVQANADKLMLCNYIELDPATSQSDVLNTRLALDPSEFDIFNVAKPCTVIFCLRELKALLAYVEAIHEPLYIRFSRGGDPIIFSQEGPGHQADFVLATLENVDDEHDSDTEREVDQIQQAAAPSGTALQQTASQLPPPDAYEDDDEDAYLSQAVEQIEQQEIMKESQQYTQQASSQRLNQTPNVFSMRTPLVNTTELPSGASTPAIRPVPPHPNASSEQTDKFAPSFQRHHAKQSVAARPLLPSVGSASPMASLAHALPPTPSEHTMDTASDGGGLQPSATLQNTLPDTPPRRRRFDASVDVSYDERPLCSDTDDDEDGSTGMS